MTNQDVLFRAELNLLLALALVITFVCYWNLENKATAGYNEMVKNEQRQKLLEANDPTEKPVSFGLSHCGSLPFWHALYVLQFLTNPCSFFLLRDRKLGSFFASLIFTSVTFYCFSMWVYETYSWMRYQEPEMLETLSLNDYFLLNSTKLEFVLFLLVSISFVLHLFFLLRFAGAKFQARISLE